jgi:hypothetical protein
MRPGSFILAMVLFSGTTAIGQSQGPSNSKWEVEIHVGGGLMNNSTSGTGSLPGPGASFISLAGFPSRRVSSWYFGDGAKLLNEVSASLRGVVVPFLPGTIFDAAPQDITALDPVLTSAVAEPQSGGAFGFRLNRAITSRFAAEFSLEYGLGQSELSPAAALGVEASRASFTPALTALIRRGGLRNPFTVTSVSAIQKTGGHQIFANGTLNINLKTERRVIPYIAVGGGIVSSVEKAPHATLIGNYQIPLEPPVRVDDTDTVTLRSTNDRTFAGVIGGGVKYFISPRWGVRVDLRANLSPNTTVTLVDASPAVLTANPVVGSCAIVPFTSPTVEFGSPLCGQSSLSGPRIAGFQTFKGSGIGTRVDVTTGLFIRF